MIAAFQFPGTLFGNPSVLNTAFDDATAAKVASAIRDSERCDPDVPFSELQESPTHRTASYGTNPGDDFSVSVYAAQSLELAEKGFQNNQGPNSEFAACTQLIVRLVPGVPTDVTVNSTGFEILDVPSFDDAQLLHLTFEIPSVGISIKGDELLLRRGRFAILAAMPAGHDAELADLVADLASRLDAAGA